VAWLALWALLLLATVLLCVLLCTRLRHVRAWRKCAIGSLWVHVLLACLAMTVHVVSGSPGDGPEKPIRVRFVAAAPEPNPEQPTQPAPQPDELLTAPPLDQTPAPEAATPSVPKQTPLVESTSDGPPDPPTTAPVQVAPSVEPPPAQSTSQGAPPPNVTPPELSPPELSPPDLSAPDLLPDSVESAASPHTDSTSPRPPLPTASPERGANRDPQAPSDVQAPHTPATPDTPDTPVPPATNATSPPQAPSPPQEYAQRFAEERLTWVQRRGGNEHTERAVRSALGWLAGAQSSDGGWHAARYGAGQERVVLGHHRQGAGARADAGVTGLALLAFLGAGHTHTHGAYSRNVAAGIESLARSQRSDGALFGPAELFAQTYCHSMATFAVCEACAITRDPRLRPMAQAAVNYSLAAQHPSDGGWRYRPGDTGDTAQLGWQLMALKSAELAGIEVPEVTWTRIERFLRQVRRGAHGGLGAYRPDGPPSRSMTAEAFFCRQLMSQRMGSHLAPLATREAIDSLLRQVPNRGHVNHYYWYYATLALNRARDRWDAAQEPWETWNDALVSTLLPIQNDDGSWPADSVWGGYGGTVYTTSMAALTLEVYYRYGPQDALQEPSAPPQVTRSISEGAPSNPQR
jgi:hypothetical protein